MFDNNFSPKLLVSSRPRLPRGNFPCLRISTLSYTRQHNWIRVKIEFERFRHVKCSTTHAGWDDGFYQFSIHANWIWCVVRRVWNNKQALTNNNTQAREISSLMRIENSSQLNFPTSHDRSMERDFFVVSNPISLFSLKHLKSNSENSWKNVQLVHMRDSHRKKKNLAASTASCVISGRQCRCDIVCFLWSFCDIHFSLTESDSCFDFSTRPFWVSSPILRATLTLESGGRVCWMRERRRRTVGRMETNGKIVNLCIVCFVGTKFRWDRKSDDDEADDTRERFLCNSHVIFHVISHRLSQLLLGWWRIWSIPVRQTITSLTIYRRRRKAPAPTTMIKRTIVEAMFCQQNKSQSVKLKDLRVWTIFSLRLKSDHETGSLLMLSN